MCVSVYILNASLIVVEVSYWNLSVFIINAVGASAGVGCSSYSGLSEEQRTLGVWDVKNKTQKVRVHITTTSNNIYIQNVIIRWWLYGIWWYSSGGWCDEGRKAWRIIMTSNGRENNTREGQEKISTEFVYTHGCTHARGECAILIFYFFPVTSEQ